MSDRRRLLAQAAKLRNLANGREQCDLLLMARERWWRPLHRVIVNLVMAWSTVPAKNCSAWGCMVMGVIQQLSVSRIDDALRVFFFLK